MDENRQQTENIASVPHSSVEEPTISTALVPIERTARNKVVDFARLSAPDKSHVLAVADQKALSQMNLNEVVTFGVPVQVELAAHLRNILDGFTRGESKEIFAFIDEIDTFIKTEIKFEEIDELVRTKLEETWYTRLLGAVGLTKYSERLRELDSEVRELLRRKVKTLGDFVTRISEQFEKEVARLIELGVMTEQAAKTYRDHIGTFRVWTAAAEKILSEGYLEEERMIAHAKESGDILEVQDVKTFQMHLRQFDSRTTNIGLEYGNTVQRLEKIGLVRAAIAEQLSGKLNGFHTTLNGISDGLLTLAAIFETRSAAESDAQWQKMCELLQGYSTDLLDKTLTDAIKQQGLRNLAYAQMFKGAITRMQEIGVHARDAAKETLAKNDEARKLIAEGIEALTRQPLTNELEPSRSASTLVYGRSRHV